MTSDAKVGVLLGLVFIFIIAFLINGLPKLGSDKNNNELTTNMVNSYDNPPGLGSRERAANRAIIQKIKPPFQMRGSSEEKEVRFTTSLPEVKLESIELPAEGATAASKENPVVKNLTDTKVGSDQSENLVAVEPTRPVFPRTYVVKAGDNLASLAKKVYGSEEGNRRVNIKRIYQANSEKLASPDEIFEGQKLLIPAPSGFDEDTRRSSTLLSSIVKKVKSVGKRHLSANDSKTDNERWYVVREGDSLWGVASGELGDGGRFKEIVKLNGDVLSDEDSLCVGMRLKLPRR